MPIWVPLLVLAAALLLVAPAGDYLGLDPIMCVAFSSVTAAGATAVLVLGWLLPALAPTHPRQTAWHAWLLLVTPVAVTTLAMSYTAVNHRQAAPVDPVGTCQRCGAPLFADHTVGRYFAVDTGYLCPPQLRRPDNRCHQLPPGADAHRGPVHE